MAENEMILELKAIESLQKTNESQSLNYLKATGYKIGLLVNFTHPKELMRRFILWPAGLTVLVLVSVDHDKGWCGSVWGLPRHS
jgi:hypothetical protein